MEMGKSTILVLSSYKAHTIYVCGEEEGLKKWRLGIRVVQKGNVGRCLVEGNVYKALKLGNPYLLSEGGG